MQSPNAANAEQAPSSDESFRARQARYTQQRQCYWDEFAASLDRWERTRGYYQRRLAEIYQFLVPPGVRVLELGCGQGDLLARLRPAYGVGVDLSPALIELSGAKALSRRHYEMIAANRSYFGKLDPFGDFDLIFGAARYSLKMVDLPIRYQERSYGQTNIRRWKHGLLLLRMAMLASRRIKFV